MSFTVWPDVDKTGLALRRSAPVTVPLLILLAAFACDDEPAIIPPPEPARITVDPTTAEFHVVGDTVRLKAMVVDKDGKVIEGYKIGWSTSDAAVATVTSAGIVSAWEKDGTATITATAGSVSATATITVVIDWDLHALTAFYNATGGPHWEQKTGWLTDAPVEEWHGVSVDENGRVVRLRLGLNDLRGSIPPEIAGLTELTDLSLSRNDLEGSIPRELGQLTKLIVLALNVNELSGPIPPELGQLSQLERVWLSDNHLSGEIPPELGQWSNVQTLILSDNQLSGTIPPELGQLTNSVVWPA